jgi:hypothetical protein
MGAIISNKSRSQDGSCWAGFELVINKGNEESGLFLLYSDLGLCLELHWSEEARVMIQSRVANGEEALK